MSDQPKTGKNAAIAFFVFSIIAVIAGIFLIAMGDYFIGIAGTISSFGQRNPIIGVGSGTGGVGFDWQINNRMSLQGVYSAQLPGFPGDDCVGGLFGGRQRIG